MTWSCWSYDSVCLSSILFLFSKSTKTMKLENDSCNAAGFCRNAYTLILFFFLVN
jgi:hypothetical protein